MEVVVILFAILILFGSKGIPDVVKNLGRGMNEIRNASNEIKKDIQKAGLEMRKDLMIDNTVEQIKKDLEEPKNTMSIDSPPKASTDISDDSQTDTNNESDTEQKEKSA